MPSPPSTHSPTPFPSPPSLPVPQCFMRLLPLCHDDNGLPCWDFNATSSKIFSSDSSALAIATSGIIEIALASDASTRARYLAAARGYLDILLSPTVLFTPDMSNALLNNGTTSWPQFGIALPYGGECVQASLCG